MKRRFYLMPHELIVVAILLMANGVVRAQTPPSAPSIAYGSYQVTCFNDGALAYLQEKVGANGSWTTVGSVSYAGTFSINFTKSSGEYFYRLAVMYTSYYGGSYWGYSSEVRVLVSSDPAPTQDWMSNQLGYSYEARIGDLNGDSLQDVFVRRTAGGQLGNGTLDNVILQQRTDHTFAPLIPTPAQTSIVAGWPISSTAIELDDINLDGFADVQLPDLGGAIPQTTGQIIFSPTATGVLSPQKVVAMGSKYSKFVNDLSLWLEDPAYYPNHASIYYEPVYGYVYSCDYRWNGEYYSYQCWLTWDVVGYQATYDFSPWDHDAVVAWYGHYKITNGTYDASVVPGSAQAALINDAFVSVFGVPLMRGILRNNCYDYQYDPITGLPCIEYDVLGMILLTNWKNRKVDVGDCRPLTPGEKAITADERIQIRNVEKVRVCNRQFLRPWIPPFRNSLMAPNGHVYIGPGFGLAWRDDYSASTRHEFSLLLHELTHVFQVRNGHCWTFCMWGKKIQANKTGGYKYWPLVSGKSFPSHNIEQQAEMVMDRFRLKSGTTEPLGVYNSANDGPETDSQHWQTLYDFIPYLQGEYRF